MVHTTRVPARLLIGVALLIGSIFVGAMIASAQVGAGANEEGRQKRAEFRQQFQSLQSTCHDALMAATTTGASLQSSLAKCREDRQALITDYRTWLTDYVGTLQALHQERIEAKRAQVMARVEEKRAEFEERRTARFTKICERYKNASTTPNGFASAFEVAGDGDKLLALRCDEVTGDVAVDVGDGENTTYVYEKGYVYDKASKKWKEMTFNGENKSGAWFVGDAFADIDLEDDATSPNLSTWVLGYTCSKESGSWKCGCKDAACTQPGWQVQQIAR